MAETAKTALSSLSSPMPLNLWVRAPATFGRYHYTDLLQPQIGHVPLLIPLAWLMMLPCAWAVASRFTGWRFALLRPSALTAWDQMLDPQMVGWGLWVWQQPGSYFGIPWLNFGGWIFNSVLLTTLLRPKPVPVRPSSSSTPHLVPQNLWPRLLFRYARSHDDGWRGDGAVCVARLEIRVEIGGAVS
ncbi:MAG: carotenoid biosynthesis protein [Ardenticatenaceae bacterium]|nr:carotenoid biosynthesis protein [Ardenticatenaceae bacterium]